METNKTIMLILLMNNTFLISEIEELVVDLGQPDCKLTNPFVVTEDEKLSPWIGDYTDANQLMISSDKILTLIEPKQTLLDKYLELTQ
jgi:hypothetical protein